MTVRLRTLLWIAVGTVLVVLSVPWFLWGDARTAAGVPIWLWWHIGWLVVASGVFAVFARTDWDRYMGVSDA
ncbi:MAG: DUF3311 domain-containing protein [Halohasta sp.]